MISRHTLPNALLRLLIQLLLIALAAKAQPQLTPLLQPGCGGPATACVNVGSTKNAGVYKKEGKTLTFTSPKPKITKLKQKTVNTPTNTPAADAKAFTKQRTATAMTFDIAVPPSGVYVVRLGMLDARFCNDGGFEISATINGGKQTTVRSEAATGATCHTPFFIELDARTSARADDGVLSISLTEATGRAMSLATVCVTRRRLLKSPCKQKACRGWQGCGEYTVMYGSLAIPDPPCLIEKSSTDTLTLPVGAYVQSANLQWAASGPMRNKTTSLKLNGVDVKSQRVFRNADFEPYYGASADVTDLVRKTGSGDYTITDMSHNPHLSCPRAHMAAWSIVIVYEADGLKNARVNVCDRNTLSSKHKRVQKVKCMKKVEEGGEARATVVAIEGETFDETFLINGIVKGTNLFFGSKGERLDVVPFDVRDALAVRQNELRFEVAEDAVGDNIVVTTIATYQDSTEEFV